jgi:putative peptidoglycan lipid II flippase
VLLLFAGLLGLARLLGFGREVVIAYHFGATRATDAYVASTALPDLLGGAILSGLFGYAIIPALARLDRAGLRTEKDELLSLATGQVMLWCGGLSLIGAVFADPLMSVIAPGLSGQPRQDAVLMLRITSPSVLLFGLAGLAAAMLNSRRSFLPAPVGLLLGNAAAIAILLAAAQFGIPVAAVTYTVAALVLATAQWTAAVARGFRPIPDFAVAGPRARSLLLSTGAAVLVLGLAFGRPLMERAMASALGPGDLAALGYSTRIVVFVSATIAIPVGTMAFPAMAARVADADIRMLRATIRRSLLLAVGLGVPAAAVLAGLADDVVRLLFERGLFTAHATHVTASVLRFYAFGLVGLAVNEVLTRALFAVHDQRGAVFAQAAGLVVNVIINIVLLPRYGVQAIGIGAMGGIGTTMLIMLLAVRRLSRLPLVQQTSP